MPSECSGEVFGCSGNPELRNCGCAPRCRHMLHAYVREPLECSESPKSDMLFACPFVAVTRRGDLILWRGLASRTRRKHRCMRGHPHFPTHTQACPCDAQRQFRLAAVTHRCTNLGAARLEARLCRGGIVASLAQCVMSGGCRLLVCSGARRAALRRTGLREMRRRIARRAHPMRFAQGDPSRCRPETVAPSTVCSPKFCRLMHVARVGRWCVVSGRQRALFIERSVHGG